MRLKVSRPGEYREVVYSEEHMRLLRELRETTEKIMRVLEETGVRTYVAGSVARGDVHRDSDIDIVVLDSGFSLNILVEGIERLGGYSHVDIVMATPVHTPKIYFYLDPGERIVVSAPLARLGRTELEFYYFGGLLDLASLRRGLRVPGVDKRLMLIQPTERGHIESSVIGREAEVARILGVSIETVLDRVRALTRRDEHGRTGVFLKQRIPYGVPVEQAIRDLCRESSVFRKKVYESLCV